MLFSTLEKQIIKHRAFIGLIWMILASFYVYLFLTVWLGGLLFLVVLPLFGIMLYRERLYFPLSKDYFRLAKTKDARGAIAKQFESFNYIQIGELHFLEEYVLFSKWGALFRYDELASLKNKKLTIGRGSFRRTAYVLTVCLKNGKEYALMIDGSEASNFITIYTNAMNYMRSKTDSNSG